MPNTFQMNVRRTFDVARFAKRASIVALAATFFTSIVIGRQSDPTMGYLIFFFAIVLTGEIHTRRTGIDVVGHNSLTLRAIGRPIALWVPIVLILYVVLQGTLGLPYGKGTTTEKIWPVFFAAVIVGFTEEFARFVWLQVLPYSPLSANLLWVVLHPQVAVLFGGIPPNVVFATFAFIFGLVMTGVMWLYESPLPRGLNRAFGPVAAMVIHGGYNVLVVVWTVSFLGIDFGVM